MKMGEKNNIALKLIRSARNFKDWHWNLAVVPYIIIYLTIFS